MRKNPRKSVLIFLLGATLASWCAADEATVDTVLSRAATAYRAADGVVVKVYQRRLWVAVAGAPGGNSFQSPVFYNVVTLRWRKPDDWYVAGWEFNRPMNPAAQGPRSMMDGYLLTKSGGTGRLSSFGGLGGRASTSTVLADDAFYQALRTRLLVRLGALALAPLLPAGNDGSDDGSVLGLQNPRLAGEETWNRHAAYRVEGATARGWPAVVWIDKESGLVLRTIIQDNRMGGPRRMVNEAVYETTVGARFASSDFAGLPPDRGLLAESMRLTDAQMGFGDAGTLAQEMSGAGGGTKPAAPAVSAPAAAPAPAVAEAQALAPGEMEGIVLIDGDEGTATGFMTRIRGVDFVVTNQHVLGQNKKITLKDLHGNVVPVQGIFGAVGSDIALLRIAKGGGSLKVAGDVLKSVKIGDKVVVVGNRLGGGVATQTSGQVLGVGPTRIEVNANFEPGNSGSPIFDLATHEVVGVATYAETRRITVEEGSSASRYGGQLSSEPAKVEKRWFGYRLDGITKWEAINLDKWHAQSERIGKFRDLSEALASVVRLDFRSAASNERLAPYIGDFEAHVAQMQRDPVGIARAVKDLMRTMRSIAEVGINDLSSDDYYDYYRTCLYWEDSIPRQVEYRKAIVEVLKKYEANSNAYVSRLRNGG